MKKILALMFSCMLTLTASAQEHLTFKGIPIDGKLTEFVNKLKAQGFIEIKVNNDSAIMKGDFSGKNCEIIMYASKKSNIVYQVGAILEKDDSWGVLKSTYDEYKSLLNSKYEEGQTIEFFKSPYEEGDGYEMTALRNNKCIYCTRYELQNGIITLLIAEVSNGSVALFYADKINEALAEREKSSQQISDL